MRTGPRAIDGEWITSPRIYKTKKLSNARKQDKRIKREHDKMLRMQQRMRNDDDDDDDDDTSIDLIPMPPLSEEGQPKSTLTNNPWVDEVLDLETGTGMFHFNTLFSPFCKS